MCVLYKFEIDISSNSREIKYQNIGRTHTQTHRHTDTHTDRQTDRLGENNTSQPLRGRGNNPKHSTHYSTWNVNIVHRYDYHIVLHRPSAHIGTSGQQSRYDVQALHDVPGRSARISAATGGRHRPIAII